MNRVYEMVVGKGPTNLRSCAIYRALSMNKRFPRSAIMKINDQHRPCHAERSEASGDPSRQILSAAKGDMSLPILPVNIHHRAATHLLLAYYDVVEMGDCSCPRDLEAP